MESRKREFDLVSSFIAAHNASSEMEDTQSLIDLLEYVNYRQEIANSGLQEFDLGEYTNCIVKNKSNTKDIGEHPIFCGIHKGRVVRIPMNELPLVISRLLAERYARIFTASGNSTNPSTRDETNATSSTNPSVTKDELKQDVSQNVKNINHGSNQDTHVPSTHTSSMNASSEDVHKSRTKVVYSTEISHGVIVIENKSDTTPQCGHTTMKSPEGKQNVLSMNKSFTYCELVNIQTQRACRKWNKMVAELATKNMLLDGITNLVRTPGELTELLDRSTNLLSMYTPSDFLTFSEPIRLVTEYTRRIRHELRFIRSLNK